MKSKLAFRLVVPALAVALAGCSRATTAPPSSQRVEAAVPFQLALGQSAGVALSSSRIEFSRVVEDSRCARNVQCVWAGDAKVEVRVMSGTNPTAAELLSLTPPRNEARVGNLTVRFLRLVPHPAGEKQSERRYVAEFVIVR